jgi:hypothetical protein
VQSHLLRELLRMTLSTMLTLFAYDCGKDFVSSTHNFTFHRCIQVGQCRNHKVIKLDFSLSQASVKLVI